MLGDTSRSRSRENGSSERWLPLNRLTIAFFPDNSSHIELLVLLLAEIVNAGGQWQSARLAGEGHIPAVDRDFNAEHHLLTRSAHVTDAQELE